jgi:hypothetical protein
MEFPDVWRILTFSAVGKSIIPPFKTAWNLVDCAIYPPMNKLLIRADFDGKGLKRQNPLLSNKRDDEIQTNSTRLSD